MTAPPTRPPLTFARIPTWALCLLLAALMLAFHGASVFGGVSIFWSSVTGSEMPEVSVQGPGLPLTITVAVLALAILLGLLWFRQRTEPLPERHDGPWMMCGWYITALLAGTLLMLGVESLLSAVGAGVLTHGPEKLTDLTDISPWEFTVNALLAGLVEEPILAALPVVLLAGRVPIGWLIALGAVVRGLMHIYYGAQGFFWAVVWGGAAVALFYWFGRVWVLILTHSLFFNGDSALLMHLGEEEAGYVGFAKWVIMVVIAAIVLTRALRGRTVPFVHSSPHSAAR